MPRRIPKPKVGDVFELVLRDGQLAYLQVVHEQAGADLSEVVRVLAGRFAERPDDLARAVAEPHEYLMFAAPRLMASQGYARLAGNWPVPAGGEWSGLRYTLVLGRGGGYVQAWVLTNGRTPLERAEVAPPVLRRRDAPVWQLGPSLDVVDTLMASREGSLEGSELEAWRQTQGVERPKGLLDADDESGVRHFAVLPATAKLSGVLAELDHRGFDCSEFTDPDVDGHLLIIRARDDAPGCINDQWDRVEEVVRASGGEYDGWESSMG